MTHDNAKMDAARIHDEIRQMVTAGELSSDEALRLMLAAQSLLLDEVRELAKGVVRVTDYQTRYPSVVWYWAHKRRELLSVLFLVFVVYSVLFSPWNVSDLRSAILHLLGLPTNIVPPPTP